MVPFERVVAELRSLYGPAHSGAGRPHLARYDELLATAAVMVGAPCPPQPFSAADRHWLEQALVGLGLDVDAPSRG